MKNMVQIFGLCVLLACTVVGQTIPNAGFETWVGDSVLTGWFTTNVPGFFKNVVRSTASHGGSYAAQGTVIRSFTGTPYAAIMQSGTNGQGFPIATRPGALRGWYKFLSDSGDGLNISTGFKKTGSGMGAGITAITAPQAVYREFVVNSLWSNGDTPDTALVNITIVNGGSRTHIGTSFTVDDLAWGTSSAVREREGGLPKLCRLEQNFPNPFNPQTMIEFTIPDARYVTLRVYNTLGQEIALLVNATIGAGSYRAEFDATNVPSGIYVCRLQAGNDVASKKMTVLK